MGQGIINMVSENPPADPQSPEDKAKYERAIIKALRKLGVFDRLDLSQEDVDYLNNVAGEEKEDDDSTPKPSE